MNQPETEPQPENVATVVLVTSFAVYLFVLHEWLFQITKPSFMSSFELGERISSLLVSPLPILALALLAVVGLDVISRVLRLQWSISALVPAFVIGTLLFMVADDYLYTMRSWGVVTSTGVFRWLLLGTYLFILYRAYRFCVSTQRWITPAWARYAGWFLGALVLGSIATALIVLINTDWQFADVEVEQAQARRLPNIIFLGSDSLETRYLSAYGYEFATTPFLERLAEQSLVFENAYADDSSKSTSSITSMLTGVSPFKLQQKFPAQSVSKRHAFQHFPAMLRKLGYRGYQRGITYYIDSGHQNVQRSFDYVNGRRLYNPGSTVGKDFSYVFNAEWVFLSVLRDRVKGRVLHLLDIVEMTNPPHTLDQYDRLGWEMDRSSIEEAKAFIARQDQAFFMHIHLLSTHCCGYQGTRSRQFTRDIASQASEDSEDEKLKHGRYLNSIRDVDALFEELVDWLQTQGKLDETVLVISSDHGRGYDYYEVVPLIIHFPGDEHIGRRTERVTLMNIVPTLLDYMGIAAPTWVDGESLLHQLEPES